MIFYNMFIFLAISFTSGLCLNYEMNKYCEGNRRILEIVKKFWLFILGLYLIWIVIGDGTWCKLSYNWLYNFPIDRSLGGKWRKATSLSYATIRSIGLPFKTSRRPFALSKSNCQPFHSLNPTRMNAKEVVPTICPNFDQFMLIIFFITFHIRSWTSSHLNAIIFSVVYIKFFYLTVFSFLNNLLTIQTNCCTSI